jgi:transposase
LSFTSSGGFISYRELLEVDYLLFLSRGFSLCQAGSPELHEKFTERIRPLAKMEIALISNGMSYKQIKHYSDEAFKRYCGVKRPTFTAMVEELKETEKAKQKSGRPSKLSLHDQLLLTLQYWREYRTLFHLGASFGIHESSAQRIVTKVEDRRASSGRFSLPSHHRSTELGTNLMVVLIDATETTIERPKKNSAGTTAARKNAIPSRLSC